MRKNILHEIKMSLLAVGIGACVFASFLFFGLRAKAAPVDFADLRTMPRQEMTDMRGAEEWVKPFPISEDELDLLAAIVYAEAGDQGYYGMQLVCDVILNRVDSPAWPSSIAGVVYQTNQFSPVFDGGLDRAWGRVTQECYDACIEELTGTRINYDIQYFSMYGCANGQFIFQYGDHYFGI